jgi:PPK2 family polyphosphate:nucleotide phosphotransferase
MTHLEIMAQVVTPKNILSQVAKLSRPYRIDDGAKFRLGDLDPNDTGPLSRKDKPRAREALAQGIEALKDLQAKLYAQDRWAVLLIFQAMDAAGKDSAIKHVMSGVNPQGCEVYSFKAPSAEELDHDFMWRCYKRLPERGHIGIFNRSYYEEVLAVRVHPEILATQKLPAALVTKHIWRDRFQDICDIERHLSGNAVVIRKFFLHVSKKEQKKRFLERLERPEKNWKFSIDDLRDRERWDDYMEAYEDAIRHTATEYAPWYVVPADNKWFTRVVVSAAIVDALASLDLKYPELSEEKKRELARSREALLGRAEA